MPTLLSPVAIQQFKDNNGNPLAGGQLYTYAAGTSTPQPSYTDATGTSANTNPVILNSRGEAPLWLTPGQFYKLVLMDASNVMIWSADQVPGGFIDAALLLNTASSTLVRTDLALNTDATKGSNLIGYFPAGVGAIGRTLQAKERDVVSVKDFGAKGDGTTDDTPAIQLAITFLAATGGTIIFPIGIYAYTNIATPSTSTGPIYFYGPGATLLKTTATGTGLLIQGQGGAGGPSGVKRTGGGVFGLRFTHGVVQTAGETIKLFNVEHGIVRDVQIELPYGGIFVQDCFDTHIDGKCYVRASISYDIKLQGTGTTPTCIDTFIDGVLGEGVGGNITKSGLVIDSGVSGVYAAKCDFAQGNYGVLISNTLGPATPRSEFLFLNAVLADTNATNGFYAAGDCKGIFFTDCWASTAGGSGFFLNSGTGYTIVGAKAFNNGKNGIEVVGAAEIYISGGVFSGNSQLTANTYAGLTFSSGILQFGITGARCGNVPGLGGTVQGYGIIINATAANNYSIIGNNCTGNTVASISDSGTGTSRRVHDNMGFNPRGYVTSPVVPASGTAQSNFMGTNSSVCIVGGTVTIIEISNGTGFVTTGLTTGMIRLPAGAQIRVTYTASPTWTWFGD